MVSLQDRKKQLTDRLQALNTRLHGIEDVLETEPTRDFEDYAHRRILILQRGCAAEWHDT